jgi:hypothetical protein
MASRKQTSRGLYLAGRNLEDLAALVRGPLPYARRRLRRRAWRGMWRATRKL